MFIVKTLDSLPLKSTPYRKYEKASRSGFGIQVSPKGTKTFFYGYKIEGKQRFMKLGVFGSMSLKEAGIQWQKWYNIKQKGYDPQTVRDNEIRGTEEVHRKAKTLKKKLEQQGTYGQLLEFYVDELRASKKRSSDNVEQVLNANAYKIVARSTKAKDVIHDDLNQTIAIIEKRGANVLANRFRSYLMAAFKLGMELDKSRTRKRSSIQFGISSNPVRDIPKSEVKEKAGERFLLEEEIKILWESLPKTNISKQIIGTLELLLATGQRVEEVLRININDIDKSTSLWEMDKTKAKRPHVVPLPAIAMQVINGLKPNKQGFLLSSTVTGKLMESMSVSQACGRYCKQTGFEKFTPRDLRRTWKTLMGKAGVSKFDRDRYQNHAMNDVSSKHYDRYDYLAEKRQAAIIWNNYLSHILFDEDRTVVPIRANQ